MTPEAVKTMSQALAVVLFVIGGLGSIVCLPYAMSPYLSVVSATGIYFCAGAVMMTGGLLAFAYLVTQK